MVVDKDLSITIKKLKTHMKDTLINVRKIQDENEMFERKKLEHTRKNTLLEKACH